DEQDDKDRRSVAGIGEGEVEAAIAATARNLQEAGKEPALAASRTLAAQPRRNRIDRRISGLVFAHAVLRIPGTTRPGMLLSSVRGDRCANGCPDIDGCEQEQPDHVDEMPVPGSRLEPEMLLR